MTTRYFAWHFHTLLFVVFIRHSRVMWHKQRGGGKLRVRIRKRMTVAVSVLLLQLYFGGFTFGLLGLILIIYHTSYVVDHLKHCGKSQIFVCFFINSLNPTLKWSFLRRSVLSSGWVPCLCWTKLALQEIEMWSSACVHKFTKAEQQRQMGNNIGKMGSGLWSYDQHIDHGGFWPQKHCLVVGRSQL